MSKGLISKVKTLIKFTDFFYSSEMLRYQNQQQYRTFTGGILSLAIIITTFIGFANMIIDTLSLSSLSTSVSVSKNDEPTYSQFTASPDKNFMFGIAVSNVNLSQTIRYFDVNLYHQVMSRGVVLNKTKITLEPCTEKHWNTWPNFVKVFKSVGGPTSICPSIGQQFNIFGKFSSLLSSKYTVQISPCTNSSDASRPCAPQQKINLMFNKFNSKFKFAVYYMNPIINTDRKNYKTYYIQDTNYVLFGDTLGSEAEIYFTDYNVNTDYSIWPFQSVTSDSGILVQSLPINRPYQIKNNSAYATFSIVKSANTITYTRQVQKLTYVFSYIGGMISAISTALFFIKIYTSFSYQIQIGLSIFKENPNIESKDRHTQLGFLSFLMYNIYLICQKLGCRLKWPAYQFISQCQAEIIEQLDIKHLIKRVIFLQHCVTHIFQDFQLKALRTIVPSQPKHVLEIRNRCNNKQKQQKINDEQIQKKVDQQIQMGKQGISEGVETKGRLKLNNDIIIEDVRSIEASGRQIKLNRLQTIRQRLKQNMISNEYQQQRERQQIMRQLQQNMRNGDEMSKRIWNSYIKYEQQYKQNSSQITFNLHHK